MPALDERRSHGALWFAFITVAFGTSYALLPLYSSNQNHHFLIGIARAGEGWLRDDWLSNTVDPFPVFSALVTIVHGHLTDTLYYLFYYLLLGAYAYGLIGIVEHIWPPRDTTATVERLTFIAILCVLHNEVIGYLLGVDLRHMPWWQMTTWGVAEQEIFGHGMFQPSAFGLLLPLAIRWFLDGWPLRATALMGLVLLVHFSYVIAVAMMTLAFMAVEYRRTRRAVPPLAIGSLALAFALPVAVYVLVRLGPSSARASAQAASVLATHLPQETDARVWLGAKAWLQVIWMIAGVLLAAETDLFPMMLLPLLAGVALTAAQLTSHSAQLALLFPWRVSVLLVPLSTALFVRWALVAWRSVWGASAAARRRIAIAAVAAIAVSMIASTVRIVLNFAYFYDERPFTRRLTAVIPDRLRADFARALRPDTLPMMDFVRETAARGDLYLVPPELERFRLRTGTPIVADLKSHPYKDTEVLDWYDRIRLVQAFYSSGGDCALLETVKQRYGATHLVADERIHEPVCAGLAPIYIDRAFSVYRLGESADAKLERGSCYPMISDAAALPLARPSRRPLPSASCSAGR